MDLLCVKVASGILGYLRTNGSDYSQSWLYLQRGKRVTHAGDVRAFCPPLLNSIYPPHRVHSIPYRRYCNVPDATKMERFACTQFEQNGTRAATVGAEEERESR